MREWCDPWSLRYSTLWDHGDTWTFVDGTRVITLGPYGDPTWETGDLEKLENELAALGVVIGFDPDRWYQADYLLFLIPAGSRLGAAVAAARSGGLLSNTMEQAVSRVAGV